MKSSRNSSSSVVGALALLVLFAQGCAHPRQATPANTLQAQLGRRPLIAVFPLQNLTGGRAPTAPLTRSLEQLVAAAGFDIAPADRVDNVLAERRLRYIGGVDEPTAGALRDALGIEAVLVSSLDAFVNDVIPRIAITSRLVSTSSPPRILWMDQVALAGNDNPGLFGANQSNPMSFLQGVAVGHLVQSLASGEMPPMCEPAGRLAPRRAFASPVLQDVGRRTIAVLPFLNETSRRDAGEVVALQFVRQLVASGSFEVVEPGLVRHQLLTFRFIMEGGVSIDSAVAVLGSLGADLVLSGFVRQLTEQAGLGLPSVEFGVNVLDRQTRELVFSSTSSATGDSGVWAFGLGRVKSSNALVCRMAREVLDFMTRGRPALPPAASPMAPPGGDRDSAGIAPAQKPDAESAPASR
jgi:hypothetical protein